MKGERSDEFMIFYKLWKAFEETDEDEDETNHLHVGDLKDINLTVQEKNEKQNLFKEKTTKNEKMKLGN
ncbi:hypothetical protein ILUMI_16461 [Ignelater luminosus]|uniref:Uncharacterized protein n=1 Tax=Ignelater luminosus TaxID=2038154 RepID=A0A8K0CR10_IGNLU|nr:hypothetical protein ILUMI_16461 [Ignelater luminosus]